MRETEEKFIISPRRELAAGEPAICLRTPPGGRLKGTNIFPKFPGTLDTQPFL